MERLYAPWRDEYVKGKKIEGCVFCNVSQNSSLDLEHKVLYRDEYCFIVMNTYPYSPGHFMVIPHEHTDKLETLPQEVWVRMSILAQQGVRLLKEVLKAQGVNIGMNLGDIAGAGIAEHIHLHLVPRWKGDTNFITTVGDTRIYSTNFDNIYNKLLEYSKDFFVVD